MLKSIIFNIEGLSKFDQSENAVHMTSKLVVNDCGVANSWEMVELKARTKTNLK